MNNKIAFWAFAITLVLFFNVKANSQDCYQLVWADEFDYSGAPSSLNWGYDIGGNGWGNNEVQTYTNSTNNSWAADSILNIKAIKSGGAWTSARLVTRQKFDFLYGRVEVRAKLPVGRGTWPAIWMLPTDWVYGGWPSSGEIDIMEHVGYDPGRVHASCHTEAYNHSIGTQVSADIMVQNFATTFHTYILEWTDSYVKMFVDDTHYFTFFNDNTNNYKTWPFDRRFHLLLNIAIGGNWGGAQGIDPTLTDALMQIDYVKVYSKTGVPNVSGPNSSVPFRNLVFKVPNNPEASYQWVFPPDVTILSGENTATVNVKWGETAGDVKATITTSCGQVTTPAHPVIIKYGPSGDLYYVPMNPNGTPAWYPNTSTGNQINLTEAENELKISYNITQPQNMPSIGYDFPLITDFSGFSFFGFKFKADPPNNPQVLRLDLIDQNNNQNQQNILNINNPVCDGNYHTYLVPVASATTFDLSSLKKMKFLFNYGVYGLSGTGEFFVKDVFFSVDNSLGILGNSVSNAIQLYPNPATGKVNIPENLGILSVEIMNNAGQIVGQYHEFMNTIDVESFADGIYFVKLKTIHGFYYSKIIVQ